MKRMHRTLCLISILSFVSAVPVARASIPPSQSVTQRLILQADDAFRHRAVPAEARKALELYEKASTETQGKDFESLWRVAMGSYFVGLRLTQGDAARERVFAHGRDAGLAAVALKPDCAECHFWAAVNMALYGQTVGAFKTLFSVQEIEKHLRKSIQLDPKYANGGAYRVLGLVEQKLPGIFGGSDSRARDDFEKAISIAPTEPLNYQFLAVLLHDSLHEKKEAIEVAKKGLAISGISPDRLESIEAQKELAQLVKGWQPTH